MERFIRHGAHIEDWSWLAYRIVEEDEDISRPGTVQVKKDILFMLTANETAPLIEGVPVPTVRIISNEACRDPEGELSWLSIDFTLDGEDDCQYNLGSFNANNQATDDARMGAYFVASPDHTLYLENFHDFTPYQVLVDQRSNGEEVNCIPLGHFSSLLARQHALTIGNDLLHEVSTVEPYASSFE